MDTQKIDNQIKLNQTKLQITNDSEQRQHIQKQLTILNLKKQIQALQDRIKQLQST